MSQPSQLVDRQPTTGALLPVRQIRALYDDQVVRVYQAYSAPIADAALQAGRFVAPPFKLEHMTWIKPSLLWMMYRSGWGKKDAGQTRILAIDISRAGFEWPLTHSCPSHPDQSLNQDEWNRIKASAPVPIQWDAERDLLLRPQTHRAIQIGLTRQAVDHYITNWIRQITDVTELASTIHNHVGQGDFRSAELLLPVARPYPFAISDEAKPCVP